MQMDVIQQVALFRGMDEAELAAALSALSAKEITYEKDETILYAGNVSEHMGLVLEGSVTIESNDVWGNRTILSHIERGGTFAETYALLEDEPMLVDVIANEKSNILFLRIGSLNLLQQDISPWRVKLIGNLLRISSQKNLHLTGRSFHTAPKSIRGRVMAYLNSVSLQKNKIDFDIPFDRQQLADYLNVERSALSRELSNMQQDGLIIVRRNHFEIAKNE
jgi:CRP-like cAMP-binding protein